MPAQTLPVSGSLPESLTPPDVLPRQLNLQSRAMTSCHPASPLSGVCLVILPPVCESLCILWGRHVVTYCDRHMSKGETNGRQRRLGGLETATSSSSCQFASKGDVTPHRLTQRPSDGRDACVPESPQGRRGVAVIYCYKPTSPTCPPPATLLPPPPTGLWSWWRTWPTGGPWFSGRRAAAFCARHT